MSMLNKRNFNFLEQIGTLLNLWYVIFNYEFKIVKDKKVKRSVNLFRAIFFDRKKSVQQ